jgi:hypothetical protein
MYSTSKIAGGRVAEEGEMKSILLDQQRSSLCFGLDVFRLVKAWKKEYMERSQAKHLWESNTSLKKCRLTKNCDCRATFSLKVVDFKLQTAEKLQMSDMRICSCGATFLEKALNMQLRKWFLQLAVFFTSRNKKYVGAHHESRSS